MRAVELFEGGAIELGWRTSYIGIEAGQWNMIVMIGFRG